MKYIALSIVIPCYNEKKRAEPALSKSIDYLKSNVKEPFEIIFVDDGSIDGTREFLFSIKERYKDIPIEVFSYSRNRGKGHAVKIGVLGAKGEKMIVTDADFSVDLNEAIKFIKLLDEYDVVVGSKKHFLTTTLNHQKGPRRILGKGFTLLTNLMLGLNFTDITCGFKGFRVKAGKDIFRRQRLDRWAYDAETLFLAKRLKYKAIEVPVKWYHVEGSKVSPLGDTFKSLKDLMLILFNYCRGKYNRKT